MKFRKKTFSLPIVQSTTVAAIFLAMAAMTTAGEPDSSSVEVLARMEQLAREGRLPDYEDLRLPEQGSVDVEAYYLQSMPLLADGALESDVVFSDVADTEPFAQRTLGDLVAIALRENFDLINSRRGLEISQSESLSAQAFFLPFVDLVGGSRISKTSERDFPSVENFPHDTKQTTNTWTADGGIEAGQNLPTGGSLTADLSEGRTRTRTSSGDGTGTVNAYDASASVRWTQPLLRGSGLLTGQGTDIGTADLRRARLAELNQTLQDAVARRDTVLNVIRQYFQILQFKQQLLVSRDAIFERYRFLDETRLKYDKGRVAESEILRAQIQFLQEIETAINRSQQLDDARENLLLLLGLPLETPISLIDVTPSLLDRGRINVPTAQEAVQLALGNRVELMQADVNVSLAEIDEQVSRNEVLPELDFDAGYTRFDGDETLSRANDFDRDTIDAGLTLRIPLQNVARREAHRRTRLRAEQEKTNRESLERRVTQEVYSAHRAVLTSEARLTVLRKRVEQARRNLELINGSFEVGYSTITEVRLSQDDLFDAETAYSNAILAYQINIAQLYVAMGLPLE